MDNQNYKRLYKIANQYIVQQEYETISDDFIREIVVKIMRSPGKRVRPVLACMGAEMFGEVNQQILDLAFAIELFHNFTLVHDDIMDEAPLRRDQSTLFKEYGSHIALLVGDVLLIEAYDVLNRIDYILYKSVVTYFNKTAKDICIGQMYDFKQESTAQKSWDILGYMEMIRLKTAVLIGRSLQLGALLVGAKEQLSLALYEIGVDLGIIFQIQDDYLDLFGHTSQVGKQKGGDILQKKKTLLYFKALEKLTPTNQKQLIYLMEEYEDSDKIEKIIHFCQEAKVDKAIADIQQTKIKQVQSKIDQLPIDAKQQQQLKQFATYLLERMS